MIDIPAMGKRQLQMESARALASGDGFGNHDLVVFNRKAHHDSHAWYRAVIEWYVGIHGDLPSKVGPGAGVKLLVEDVDEDSDL